MTDIRIRDGALQCATRTYRHNDGRTFTLIGVAHIARADFWEHVTHTIADAEDQGHEIHYEMVTDPDNHLTDDDGLPELFKGFAQAFNLTTQYDGLHLNPKWHNTDMTITQILDASTDPAMTLAWIDRPVNDVDITDDIKPLLLWLILRVIRFRWISWLLTPGPVHKVINTRRSDYATNRMLSRNVSITTIWGAAHLQRMGRNLRRAGFQLAGTSWVTAIGGVR